MKLFIAWNNFKGKYRDIYKTRKKSSNYTYIDLLILPIYDKIKEPEISLIKNKNKKTYFTTIIAIIFGIILILLL